MVRAFPALWLLGAIIVGISLADRLGGSGWVFPLFSLLAFTVGLTSRRRWFGTGLILLAAGLAASAMYTLKYHPDGTRHISALVKGGATATIFAGVSDWPDLKARRTDIPLEVDSLLIDQTMYLVEGGLLLTVNDTTTLLQRGDRIIFRARLYPLPPAGRSGFDYARYLNLKGLFGRVYLPTLLDVQIDRRSPIGVMAAVDRLRYGIIKVFRACLTPTSAALANGLLLGETRGIEPRVYAMFRDSGTLHLLAVSGSNVALVLLVFLAVCRPLRMPLVARRISMLVVVVVYALLCHLEPSVVRASIMAALVIGARLLHRKIDLNHIIALTAVVILLYDPGQLFDVGFQLSFVTAWGLIFIVPRITRFFKHRQQSRWYRWMVFPLIVSLVAQVVSMPLSLLYFQRLPLVAIPANLVVVPLVTLCVLGLAAVLGAYLLHPLLGVMIGSWVDPLHRLTIRSLDLMGGDRMPLLEGYRMDLFPGPGWLLVLMVYGLMIMAALALQNRRVRRVGFTVTLSLLLGAVATAALRGRDDGRRALVIHSIPGGYAAVRPVGEREADLVISAATDQAYPIDSVVIKPLLASHAIDSLHYLFCLEPDFGVLTDLWRLASSYGADSVFVEPSRRAHLADVRHRIKSIKSDPRIAVLTPVDYWPVGDGYLAGSQGVWMSDGRRKVLFAVRAPTSRLMSDSGLPAAALVIGRRWQPSPSDWVNLAEYGFSPIIASSVRPFGAAGEVSLDLESAEALPDYIIDLKRQGGIVLTSPDNSWRPLD